MGDRALQVPESVAVLPWLAREEPAPLACVEEALAAALGCPVGGPSLEEFVSRGKVVLVLPDATRPVPTRLTELLIDHIGERLAGVRIANGTHRRSTEAERRRLLGRHFGRVPLGDRSADDSEAHRALDDGLAIDREAASADRLVLMGPVSFHYLAGFGGGGKLVAPGLADRRTAEWVHRACLAPGGGRHPRARARVLEGNPLRERIEALCRRAPPQLYVIPLLDSKGAPIRIFAGERAQTFAAACRSFESAYGLGAARFDTVVVSAGGSPYDLDFVQAHKALEAAAAACSPGGTILFVASCREGLPARHRDFLARHRDAGSMEASLRERFDIAGHTVWAARGKAERFRIVAVTELDARTVEALGMEPACDLSTALATCSLENAAVMPFGARFMPAIQ